MPAMFKANERFYKRTFGLYDLEALNHRSELKILWDTFRSQDRKRSQKIEHGSIIASRL